MPLTEYQWGAALNFTYAPLLGKFAGFSDFIFQYDAYVVGVLKAGADLLAQASRVARTEAAALPQDRVEGQPFEALHGDEEAAVRLVRVVEILHLRVRG